jgi:hypothetical protein
MEAIYRERQRRQMSKFELEVLLLKTEESIQDHEDRKSLFPECREYHNSELRRLRKEQEHILELLSQTPFKRMPPRLPCGINW